MSWTIREDSWNQYEETDEVFIEIDVCLDNLFKNGKMAKWQNGKMSLSD